MKRAKSIETQSPVTLKDIAERCGVHIMTVSRAMRHDSAHVSRETAEHVRAVAAEIGYDPSRTISARRLVARRHNTSVINRTVALIYPPNITTDPFAGRLFTGITEVLVSRQFATVLIYSFDPTRVGSEITTVPPILTRGEVDGVLVLSGHLQFTQLLDQLRHEAGFGARPVVSLMEPFPGCGLVMADEFRAGYDAMAHLLELGHRHFLTFDAEAGAHKIVRRQAGFQQALLDAHCDPIACLHSAKLLDHPDWQARVATPLRETLQQHPEITAVLAPHDLYADLIVQLLREQGRRVPEEISVVSFDDTRPVLHDAQHTQLTSVHFPLEEIGRSAASMLLDAVEGERSPDAHQIVMPGSLIVRGSTAGLPARCR